MRICAVMIQVFVLTVAATASMDYSHSRWQPPSNQDSDVSPVDMPNPERSPLVTAQSASEDDRQRAQTASSMTNADRIDLVQRRRARHSATIVVSIIVAVSAIMAAGITFMIIRCVHYRRCQLQDAPMRAKTTSSARGVFPETRGSVYKMPEAYGPPRHWNNRWSTVQHNLIYARGHPSMVVPLDASLHAIDHDTMSKSILPAEKSEEQGWWWWHEAPVYEPPSEPEQALGGQTPLQYLRKPSTQDTVKRDNLLELPVEKNPKRASSRTHSI